LASRGSSAASTSVPASADGHILDDLRSICDPRERGHCRPPLLCRKASGTSTRLRSATRLPFDRALGKVAADDSYAYVKRHVPGFPELLPDDHPVWNPRQFGVERDTVGVGRGGGDSGTRRVWFRRYSTEARLARLEHEARDARRGLWADRDPIPPWDFRRRVPSSPTRS
jgi:hypothetical protein